MPVISILQSLGIASLNPMQEEAMHIIPKEKETLLLSPTGSGKTLAFLLPLASLLDKRIAKVQCLVLVPSRELALQVESVWRRMGTGLPVSCCYGGHDMQTEIQNLAGLPVLVVGTPGRIADHIRRDTFSREALSMLVFDEFDKSLALGFEEEMLFVVRSLPAVKKKIFVSATASIHIPAFAGGENVKVLDHISQPAIPGLTIMRVISKEKDKIETLYNLLCQLSAGQALIFCNHREAVERTAQLLKEKQVETAVFHGGMEQMQREQALVRFSNGSVRFLVATDLAARGLDIPDVAHVIHYHLPATAAEFTHRNGRTARMEKEGVAYLILHAGEPLPAYIPGEPPVLTLGENLPHPKSSEWVTLFINGGKKDKLNKVDIVGFLGQKGKLLKEEIGLITVKDHNSFVAVPRSRVKALLATIQDQKIKGVKYRVAQAR